MKLFLFFLLCSYCGGKHFHSPTNYTKWDWNEIISELTQAFKHYHLEQLLPSLDLRDVNLTNTCREDIMFLSHSITDLLRELEMILRGNKTEISKSAKQLALPMLDSSSKIGPGILRGHIHFLGFLPQCLKVKYFAEELKREIRGDYYRVFINLHANESDFCTDTYDCPSMDFCLPHSCKQDKLTPLFQSIKTGKWKNRVSKAEHINVNIPPPDIGTYIILTIFLVLISFCVLSSIIDLFWLSKTENELGRYSYIFIAFSFHRNVKNIFTINISEEDHISVLHCMRFFSIAWVISAHTYGFLSLIVKNPLDQLDSVREGYWTAFYANGFPAVDSFFYMSGLLLSYLWFKELRKNCSNIMSLKGWVFFYIHRFFRLSPAYYLTLLFYTFVFSRWYTNMPVLILSEIQNDTCRDQWWINALYLNNFINQEKMCYVVSWYLAVDIQLFVFSPLLLIPFAFSGYVGGLSVATLIISVSTSLSFYQVYRWNFPPFLYRLNEQSKEANNCYQFWMYYQPYIRCQPYVVGIVVGYFLQFKKRLNVPHMLNCILFLFSFCTLFFVVFGLNDFLKGNPITTMESAMYNGLAKLGWSLALAWITISCYYNHGGAVQSFMSWWIWIPLGRLSFCAYLIHIPLILFVWGLDKSEKMYAGELDAFINNVMPAIFYSFGMAIIWKALVEMPFARIEVLFCQRWTPQRNFMIKKFVVNMQTRPELQPRMVSIINKDFCQL